MCSRRSRGRDRSVGSLTAAASATTTPRSLSSEGLAGAVGGRWASGPPGGAPSVSTGGGGTAAPRSPWAARITSRAPSMTPMRQPIQARRAHPTPKMRMAMSSGWTQAKGWSLPSARRRARRGDAARRRGSWGGLAASKPCRSWGIIRVIGPSVGWKTLWRRKSQRRPEALPVGPPASSSIEKRPVLASGWARAAGWPGALRSRELVTHTSTWVSSGRGSTVPLRVAAWAGAAEYRRRPSPKRAGSPALGVEEGLGVRARPALRRDQSPSPRSKAQTPADSAREAERPGGRKRARSSWGPAGRAMPRCIWLTGKVVSEAPVAVRTDQPGCQRSRSTAIPPVPSPT